MTEYDPSLPDQPMSLWIAHVGRRAGIQRKAIVLGEVQHSPEAECQITIIPLY